MVTNDSLRFRNSVRNVFGTLAKKETAEFYMLYKLLTAGDAEMQKARFFEVLGKTEVNPNLSKRNFMTWLDEIGINLPELITELCEQTYAHELAKSRKAFDYTLQRGVI